MCQSAHRIKADHVMEIVSKTIKEVIQYASLDKERFAEEIQSHIVRVQLERMKELCKERNNLYEKQNDLKGQKWKIEKSLER